MNKPTGFIPKRSDQVRRRNQIPGLEQIVVQEETRGPELPLSVMDPHPLAVHWYQSLRTSGQAYYYEDSDWAQAAVLADILSRALLQGDRPSALLIQQFFNGAAELLTTEGTRRRMRLEILRGKVADEDEDAAVVAMRDYQARMSGT